MPLQNAIQTTLNKYGDASKFLLTFSPSIQTTVAQNVERAFLGTAPTINVICKTYNSEIAISWIMAQLENINDFCGVNNKMQTEQMEEVARIISVDFYYLKVTELLLFFHRLKSGKYGSFYGVIDAIKVMESLSKFSQERITEINSFERKKADQEMQVKREEWSRLSVSREQYDRLVFHRKLIKVLSKRHSKKLKHENSIRIK